MSVIRCAPYRLLAGLLATLLVLVLLVPPAVAPPADAAAPLPLPQTNRALPTDLTYNTETRWLLPGLPDLNATSGYIPHNFSHGEAIFKIGNETIHGFRPGKAYPEMYVRDIAWGMETAQYYYPDEYLREPIEAYLRRQYTASTVSLDSDFGVTAGAGAIGGIITPQGRSNKQTITTDEETSLIHAAYLYYKLTYNSAWLRQPINGRPIIERLNLAADWLYTYRLDPDLQLLWRGHTTDWGDVKFEPGPGYTDYNPTQDHRTASIYDQALAYLALLELAKMNAAVGNTARADEWQTKAETLKAQTNALLWQPDRGFYLTHAHISPLTHNFDEAAMVSISNALAVYAGLTTPAQSRSIFENLEQAQQTAGVNKPGLSIYPFYPNQWPNLFFEYPGMGYGNYQNGGVWDWWGGVQIKAEFLHGYSDIGRRHLLQVANDWQDHPGNIIEWQSSTDPRHEGSHYYSAAAGTMGSAIIEGFFGLQLTGQGLTIQPRLGLNDGYIRLYQAATDRYVAYSYDWNQEINRLSYGTNAGGAVQIKLLKLRSEQISSITVDGQPVEFGEESIGQDSYLTFLAPSGRRDIEIIKQPPPAINRAADSSASAEGLPAQQQNQSDNGLDVVRNTTAPPAHQAAATATAQAVQISRADNAANPRLVSRHNKESWLMLLQVTSAVLVAATSLGLLALTIIRRRLGLHPSSRLASPKRPPKSAAPHPKKQS